MYIDSITITVRQSRRFNGTRAVVTGPNGIHEVIYQTGGTVWSNGVMTGGTWAARSRPGTPHFLPRYTLAQAAEDVAAACGVHRSRIVVDVYPIRYGPANLPHLSES